MARVEVQRFFFKNVFINAFGVKQRAFRMELEGGREHLLRHLSLACFENPVSNVRMFCGSVGQISVITVDLKDGQGGAEGLWSMFKTVCHAGAGFEVYGFSFQYPLRL